MPSSFWTPFAGHGLRQTFVKPALFRRVALSLSAATASRSIASTALARYAPPARLPVAEAAQIAGSVNCHVNQVIGPDAAMEKVRENRAAAGRRRCAADELVLGCRPRWTDAGRTTLRRTIRMAGASHNNPDVILERGRCADVRDVLAALRRLNPQILSQTYDFVTDIYKPRHGA